MSVAPSFTFATVKMMVFTFIYKLLTIHDAFLLSCNCLLVFFVWKIHGFSHDYRHHHQHGIVLLVSLNTVKMLTDHTKNNYELNQAFISTCCSQLRYFSYFMCFSRFFLLFFFIISGIVQMNCVFFILIFSRFHFSLVLTSWKKYFKLYSNDYFFVLLAIA